MNFSTVLAVILILSFIGYGIWYLHNCQIFVMRDDVGFVPSPHFKGSLDDIYVLRTHKWDRYIEELWWQMRCDLGENQVWVFYDVTGKRPLPNVLTKRKQVVTVTEEECKAINKWHVSGWHSVESPLTILYRKLRQRGINYSHLWMIEYDVRCTGNWHHVLQRAVEHCYDADFVATFVEPFNLLTNGSWCWWWWTQTKGDKPPELARTKSFLPISRYTPRVLKLYSDTIGEWSDFCELYLPTRCKQAGMTCGNLGSKYLGTPYAFCFIVGCHKWQASNYEPDKLYHPIK